MTSTTATIPARIQAVLDRIPYLRERAIAGTLVDDALTELAALTRDEVLIEGRVATDTMWWMAENATEDDMVEVLDVLTVLAWADRDTARLTSAQMLHVATVWHHG